MAAPDSGDVLINGDSYKIDLQSYRKRDITDFSPRAATPGGSIIHSELGLYQPLLQNDWRHGIGFIWYTDALGYHYTTGRVDTRHGNAMMFTNSTSSDTANIAKAGFCNFNGAVYSWGTGGGGISGVRKYSGGAWADIAQAATGDYGTVNHLLPTKTYLFVCPDGARIEKLDTSDVATVAGVDANATDYKWLIIHNGYIYAGKDGTNVVHYGGGEGVDDLSDLHGDVAGDTNEIYVGGGGLATLGAISAFAKLYVARADGLWEIGDDHIARIALNFADQASSSNFASMAVHNGYLVFPIRSKLYQWNGARLSDITPGEITDTFPYVTYGNFKNLTVVGSYLFMTARTNETTYYEDLLCFDGVGWHRVANLITDGSGTICAMGYDTVNNYLWYHEDDAADVTYYIPFQSLSDYPYAAFPTTGTHVLVSSRLDMGFRRVKKSCPSILVDAGNIVAKGTGTSDCYLQIYYSLDGGAWTAWGGTDGTTNTIDANGVNELTDPLGTGSSTIEFNYMQIKVQFITEAAAQSPILEGITVRFLMRPNESYGWNADIIGASHAAFGPSLMDSRTASTILSNLETARASKSPIAFVDPFGTSHQVYISALVERAIERHAGGIGDEGGVPNIEHRINVNLVEVG